MAESIIAKKAEDFAVRIVKCAKYVREQKEYSLADQMMRSGTSICANVFEAKYAQSTADFISKYSIALKEASETKAWLRILYRTDIITPKIYESMISDLNELLSMLVSAVKSLKEK
jgi:four helix bundle protein